MDRETFTKLLKEQYGDESAVMEALTHLHHPFTGDARDPLFKEFQKLSDKGKFAALLGALRATVVMNQILGIWKQGRLGPDDLTALMSGKAAVRTIDYHVPYMDADHNDRVEDMMRHLSLMTDYCALHREHVASAQNYKKSLLSLRPDPRVTEDVLKVADDWIDRAETKYQASVDRCDNEITQLEEWIEQDRKDAAALFDHPKRKLDIPVSTAELRGYRLGKYYEAAS